MSSQGGQDIDNGHHVEGVLREEQALLDEPDSEYSLCDIALAES